MTRAALVTLSMLLLACGGAPNSPSPGAPAEDRPEDDVEEQAPAPRARAVARYGCDAAGRWRLDYQIGEDLVGCAETPTEPALAIAQRPDAEEGPERFSFRLGPEAGEGVVCRAPAPCADGPHRFTITGGEPPRVEWSLTLSDESIEHGQAAVLLCNDGPPPPCELRSGLDRESPRRHSTAALGDARGRR